MDSKYRAEMCRLLTHNVSGKWLAFVGCLKMAERCEYLNAKAAILEGCETPARLEIVEKYKAKYNKFILGK